MRLDVENASRVSRNLPIITQSELDTILDKLIEHTNSGGTIQEFSFSATETSPHKQIIAHTPTNKADPVNGNSRISLQIDKCENGYVMIWDGSRSFVFRDPGELWAILRDRLFAKTEAASSPKPEVDVKILNDIANVPPIRRPRGRPRRVKNGE